MKPSFRLIPLLLAPLLIMLWAAPVSGQGWPIMESPRGPRVSTPTAPTNPFNRVIYPWKQYITATVFWIGEQPTARNPTPNHASSWDTQWQENYGGYDNPDQSARINYRPKAFTPKLNPFYIALPYNDCLNHKEHCPHASRVIPWWQQRLDKRPGKSACKGRWVQIVYDKKVCYAQWEDCGPFCTDDWQYVFQGHAPKPNPNGNAGIDISPAVRDFLGIRSGYRVSWKFVEDHEVPHGPWADW